MPACFEHINITRWAEISARLRNLPLISCTNQRLSNPKRWRSSSLLRLLPCCVCQGPDCTNWLELPWPASPGTPTTPSAHGSPLSVWPWAADWLSWMHTGPVWQTAFSPTLFLAAAPGQTSDLGSSPFLTGVPGWTLDLNHSFGLSETVSWS